MPMYDLVCANGHEQFNQLLRIGERPPCPQCGGATETLWRSSSNVIGDDIPGGLEVRNGICNPDGTPKKFYTKRDVEREGRARGYTNLVQHVPERGSDKSKHTTRWI